MKEKGSTPSKNKKNIENILRYTKARFFSRIRLNNQELLIKRSELIDIYNNSLSNALKQDNKKKEKKAEKYKPEAINNMICMPTKSSTALSVRFASSTVLLYYV